MPSSPFVFVLVAAVFGLATKGHLKPSPDMRFYIPMADALRTGYFQVLTTSAQANFTIIAYLSLLAVVRAIWPGHWPLVMLAINVVCAGITGVLLVKIVRMVTGSIAAMAIALLFYIGCYDIVFWAGLLETDHIYTAVATLVFLLSLRGILHPEGPQRARRMALAVAVLVATVTRPVGFVLVPVVILTEWFFVQRAETASRRALWILLGLGVAFAFLAHAYFVQDMNRWPTDWMRPKLVEYAAREQAGEVVYDHRESSHRPPVTMVDYVAIEADRFVRFFQITSSANSAKHNLINIVYYVPVYLLALIGFVDAVRSGDRRRSALAQAPLLWLVAMVGLSAVTVLDYDWRYRLPLMIQIILLTACGAQALVRRFRGHALQQDKKRRMAQAGHWPDVSLRN